MSKFLARIAWMQLSILVPIASATAAATVNYQGLLYNTSGSPLQGGFVIAGTFKPGFNPVDVACTYGDAFCNVGNEYYSMGVADGTIRPIGSGAFTGLGGTFSGTGITNEPAGSRIYLFGFPAFSGYDGVLATSNDSSYVVPPTGGTTTINAALTNQFIFGQKFGDAIAVAGLPIPEPATATLAALAVFALIASRRR